MEKYLVSILLTVFISGCAVTKPVAVVSKDGIMRGTATATLATGSFSVSDKKRTCAGSYDALDMTTTISMPFQCDDGRKGIAIVTRDPSGLSGHGRVRMDDGTEADLIFGDSAASL